MIAQDQAFKAMVENSSELIAIVDRDGTIVYESPYVIETMGYLPEEMVGKNMADFIHPEDLERVGRTYGFLAEAPGASVETDLRFRHKNGTWLQLEGKGRNLLDTPGINGILVHYRDVTKMRQEQQEIADMLAEYQFVADNVVDVIWRADSTLRLDYISRAVTAQLGYSVEEALSMSLVEMLTPTSYDEVIKAANELLDEPGTKEVVLELENFRKDGSIVWTETSCRIIRDKEGRPKAILGVARDVTRRKKAEELLQQHQEMLEEEVKSRTAELESANQQLKSEIEERIEAERALQTSKEFAENLIATANAMVVGTDNAGNILIFNQAAENITGYTKEEVLGRNWFELIVPRDRYPEVWNAFKNHETATLPRKLENPIVNKSGQERHVMWQNGRLIDQGKIVGILAFGIDITERKRAERRLERAFKREKQLHEHLEALVKERTRRLIETEQRFRQLVDNSPDIIASFDRELRHVAANKAISNITGLSEEEIIGKSFDDLDMPGEVAAEWNGFQRRVIDSGETVTAETCIPTPEGPRFFELLLSPLNDEAGRITGSTAIARDVTERKRAEDDLRELSRRIVKLQEEERSSLSHDLHDEIGQTLTFLSLQLERIRRGSPDSMRETIQEAKSTLAETIRKVRDLSYALHPTELEIGLVQALVDLRKKFVEETGIDLRLEHQVSTVMPWEIALALYRIVQESLTNIMRHSGADLATVRIREADSTIELVVEDNGVGFDMKAVGRSAGLSGMRERALSLGGEYRVESQPGAGTQITVRIPLSKSES